jgi:hypothetical protein
VGYYAENGGNSLPTFRDKLSAKNLDHFGFLTLEDGTDRLSRKVGNELQLLAV